MTDDQWKAVYLVLEEELGAEVAAAVLAAGQRGEQVETLDAWARKQGTVVSTGYGMNRRNWTCYLGLAKFFEADSADESRTLAIEAIRRGQS